MTSIKENIYIVGHRRPDLDSIASVIGYHYFKQSQGYFNYHAIRCDKINPVTEWILERFKVKVPPYIPDISGMTVVLLDHTYSKSRAKGWESANIIEVIDHHDVKLEDIIPKSITIRPCGSTSTLITEKIIDARVNIPSNIAAILLCAILDDTLGFKSPTTTQLDREMVTELAKISEIEDIEGLTKEIFTIKDVWSEIDAREIVEMDIKEVEIENKKLSISQVETVDREKLREKEDDILNELESINGSNSYDLRIVMITDLTRGDCILLFTGKDKEILIKHLGSKYENNRGYLSGIVSRKKQLLPLLTHMYESNKGF